MARSPGVKEREGEGEGEGEGERERERERGRGRGRGRKGEGKSSKVRGMSLVPPGSCSQTDIKEDCTNNITGYCEIKRSRRAKNRLRLLDSTESLRFEASRQHRKSQV